MTEKLDSNKTLADAQPGGRVRLGDQAELDRLEFQAWAEQLKHTLTRWGNGPGDVMPLFVSEVAGNYISPATQAAWEAWRHLSAQPSPGGQVWPFVESPADFAERMVQALRKFDMLGAVRHVLIENPPALAARQPVGEPVGEPVGYIEFLDRQNDSLRRAIHAIMAKLVFLLDEDQFADVDAIALAAGVSPPAQAVDLGQFRELVTTLVDRCGDDLPAEQFTLAGRLLNLIDGKA